MLNNKKLQAIRDKILGVTVNPAKYGDLNSVVYLQQILDAVQGVTSTPTRVQGNLNEKIYLQKIRNAKRGVADGQFGSLSNSVYLQQIINAYNGIADGAFGSLSEETYLDRLISVAAPSITYVPTDGANLKLWFKADAGTFSDAAMTTPAVADGATVCGWQDYSGNAKNATIAVNGPTLKLNIKNGKPVLRFDGINDQLSTASYAHGIGAGAFFFAFVAKINVSLPNNTLMFMGPNEFLIQQYSNPTRPVGAWFPGEMRFNTVLPVGIFYLIELWRDSGIFKCAINGVQEATTIPTATNIATQEVGFGREQISAGAFALVDLAEVVVYKLFDPAIQTGIRSYMRSRWAVY